MIRHTWRGAPRDLKILMTSSFLMVIGFYALIPRLTLHLTGSVGWTMAIAGLVLASRQVSQQGLSFVGGLIVDRIGPKKGLVLGVSIRGLGFLSFGIASTLPEYCIAAVISGIGGCLFDPAEKSAFEHGTKGRDREELFALREVIDNGAFAVSALLGVAISLVPFTPLSFVSGGIYLLVAILDGIFLSNAACHGRKLKASVIQIPLRNRKFLNYTLILTGYYYLSCQLYSIVAQQVVGSSGSVARLSILYGIIALFVVAAQIPFATWLKRFRHRFRLIGLGTFLMGAGLASLYFANWGGQLLFAVLYSIGLITSAPLILEVVPYFAPRRMRATYYGLNNYAIGIGGVLSTTFGGYLYDLGAASSRPWIPCLGSLTAGGLVWLLLHYFESKMPINQGRYRPHAVLAQLPPLPVDEARGLPRAS